MAFADLISRLGLSVARSDRIRAVHPASDEERGSRGETAEGPRKHLRYQPGALARSLADERRFPARVHLGSERQQRLFRARAAGPRSARVRETGMSNGTWSSPTRLPAWRTLTASRFAGGRPE